MNIKEKTFKYIMVFLGTIFVVVIIMIATGDKSGKKATISNGVDIPVMPTAKTDKSEDSKSDKLLQAVVIDVDKDKHTMILQQTGTDSKITYSYTGGTEVSNRYDEAISVNQLKIGEVVDIEFAADRKLSKVKVSDGDWEYQGVTDFKIDTQKKLLTVGSSVYSYTDNTVIIDEYSETTLDKLESIDVVTLKGKDKQLDSIIVTTGHGYVRLDSTTFFEGGFVEIGSKIVQLITENMVIPVPVGDYTLTVTKDKTSGSKDISVESNEEIRVNLIEFQSDAVRLGTLSFKIVPAGAKLTIDGVVKDYSDIIDVAYGTHKIVISAKGYDTYSQIINVQDIFKEYNISLSQSTETSAADTKSEKDSTDESESQTSENTSSANNTNSKSNQKQTTSSKKSANNTTKTTTYQTIDYSKLIGSLFGD